MTTTSVAHAIGIIGGSGVYQLQALGAQELHRHNIKTPYGDPSDEVIEFTLSGFRFFFLARHGMNHAHSPSEVNYRANIYALKSLGVKLIVSISAVGSLQEQYLPGDFVLVDQFMDFTKGKRARTFFEGGIVGHISCAEPINAKLFQAIATVLSPLDCAKLHVKGTYICIEGPQFSTKAESHFYKNLGGAVIGMTNVPEAYLAKECSIHYATLAAVTDFDCWKEELGNVSVDEVVATMKKNSSTLIQYLKVLLPTLSSEYQYIKEDHVHTIMTKKETISEELWQKFSVILS